MQERRTTKGCSKICKVGKEREQHSDKGGNNITVTYSRLIHTLDRLSNSINKLNQLNK